LLPSGPGGVGHAPIARALANVFLPVVNTIGCYNNQQQLKLHNDEEKGKRIFGKLAGKLVITRLLKEFEVC